MAPSGLPTTAANRVIDWSHGLSATAPTTPMKVAITTTAPTASAAGTKVSGPADQTLTQGAAASNSSANTTALTWSGMPATTTVGVDEYDAVPFRWWFGQLATSRTTSSGDILTIAIGSYTTAINPST